MTVEAASWSQVFNFDGYSQLLPIVQNTIVAGAVVGLVGGLLSSFVMMRDLPFAVHGIAELSFAGAEAFLLFGWSVVTGSIVGSIVAALIIGLFGVRARDRNSIIGVLMPFGLGLGVLCLKLYQGRSENKFGLLIGQFSAVSDSQLVTLSLVCGVVLLGLLLVWRPLTFASVDPALAVARGVPVRALSVIFMLLLGLGVAMSVQIIGPLLVLSIACTPAAAAQRVSSSPAVVAVLSTVFATVSMLGGALLSVGADVPPTPYVTTIAFVFYAACRIIGLVRHRRGRDAARRVEPATPDAAPVA